MIAKTSPFQLWMDDNIQGKYAVSSEIITLMAMAFEGGQKSITEAIDLERELIYKNLSDERYEQFYQFNLLKSEKQYYQSHTERLVGILDEKNAEIKKLKASEK